jgi:prepilin peptidase CpaA
MPAVAVTVALGALLLAAAVYDIIDRRIPNWTIIALLVLFLPAALLGATLSTWPWSLAAFGVALLGSGALYLMGGVGAGDTKLFAATALYAGFAHLLMFTVVTILAGGLLALGLLVARPRSALRSLTARGRAEGRSRGIPYGVAIAAGGLFCAVLIATPHLPGASRAFAVAPATTPR